MTSSLTRLTKILKLEAEQGYANKAVIGGLEKLLGFWEPLARRENLPDEFIGDLAARLKAYAPLDAAGRQAAIAGLLQAVTHLQAGKPLPPVAPPPESSVRPQPEEAAAPSSQFATPNSQFAIPNSQFAIPSPPAAPGRPLSPARDGRAIPRPKRPRVAAPPPRPGVGLDSPVTVLSGLGSERARLFEKLGVKTLGDLLLLFPRRYDDYSQLKPINRLKYGEEVTVIGTIWETRQQKIRGGQNIIVKSIISDSTGALECTWFNQPWLADKLKPGRQIVLSGKIDQYLGRLVMNSPEWEPLEKELLHTGRIVPVYPLTAGLTSRWLRRLMRSTVEYWSRRVSDPLPEAVRQRAGLMSYGAALEQIHFPDSWEALRAARTRLAFDELLMLQLGLLRQRREWQATPAAPLRVSDEWLGAFLAALPFSLTPAQQRALADLRADLARETPMNRLLQGDVGSGKTVLAAAAMAIAVASGAQAAMMAPTSILAEQHYRNISRLLANRFSDSAPQRFSDSAPQRFSDSAPQRFSDSAPQRFSDSAPQRFSDSAPQPFSDSAIRRPLNPPNIRLLQGSTPDSEKAEIYAGLQSGSIDIVIGTHALIEGGVEFANLGAAVVDEQHRFGVEQRAALRGKGRNPHLLVMTATPIPRTLALSVYGDLDLSVLDEMPPGRQPIETRLLYADERERAYQFVRAQVSAGRQAYIIYPLIAESEKIDARAATEDYERLSRGVFHDLRLGLLHGRLRPAEKEEVMVRFQRGELDILVSTSVVEVGVDVPNATVMLIEGAQRFGLAQLHQFRGRVGRGEHKSYCLLVAEDVDGDNERLRAVEASTDGFALAEKDLELRGPGEFLGTRQSGFGDLRLARLTDLRLIETARRQAQLLFEDDPDLNKPEHAGLAAKLADFWVARPS